FHITPQLDLVAGYRVTRDEKWGFYRAGSPGNYVDQHFDYEKTNPNYSLGVNYKTDNDILLYAKYSTSFVSGGSVAGLAFDPEEADSWEVGMKGDFLEGRLRANLVLFDVTYENVQSAASGNLVPGFENVATLIIEGGDNEAEG